MAILIVEDSATVAQMLSAVLTQGGCHDIYTVYSGEEALDFLEKQEDEAKGVDLILLDVMLPGINGLEVCRKVKGMKNRGMVPVIVVTARNDEETMAAAFDAGAWDFLAKPVRGAELVVRVKAALAKKKEIEKMLCKARG